MIDLVHKSGNRVPDHFGALVAPGLGGVFRSLVRPLPAASPPANPEDFLREARSDRGNLCHGLRFEMRVALRSHPATLMPLWGALHPPLTSHQLRLAGTWKPRNGPLYELP
jgi:hypothetical protein